MDGDCRGFVSVEVGGVDIEANQRSGSAELDDAPVKCGVVSTRFPARVESTVWTELALEALSGLDEEQVMGRCKEIIRNSEDLGANCDTR